MYCFLCLVLLMGYGASGDSGSGTEFITSSTEASQPPSESPNNESATTVYLSNRPLNSTPMSGPHPSSHHSTKMTQGTKQSTQGTKQSTQGTTTNCAFCFKDLMKPVPLFVIGALGITCITLLITTLVLACNVCCLKRQISNSYRISSDNAQVTTQSTARRASVDGEHSETVIMMSEITNCKAERDENQMKPEEPEKQEETAQEVDEVTNQAFAEDFAQNEEPTVESPPYQDHVVFEEDVISE